MRRTLAEALAVTTAATTVASCSIVGSSLDDYAGAASGGTAAGTAGTGGGTGGGAAAGGTGGWTGADAGPDAAGSAGASGTAGDAGGHDAGDGAACPPGRKRCGADCVVLDDPNTGCAEAGCEPCTLPYAAALCAGGACAISQCAAGHDDCDDLPATGCEADLESDIEHCGDCATSCALAHADVACNARKCAFVGCVTGYTDCDGDETNGCETNIAADPQNCGSCGNACTAPAGKTATCTASTCGVSDCAAPLADCDQDGTGSCETNLQTSAAHCGFCGNACSYAHGQGACSGGCQLASCDAGWGDCDDDASNGCETATSSSVQHCLGCGNACPGGAHATAACKPGGCGLDCDSGWGDCSGGTADGCETQLTSNAHCRACANAIGVSGGGDASQMGFVAVTTPGGSQLAFETCSSDGYSWSCSTVTVPLAGFTASGGASPGIQYALRSVTASGSQLVFELCYDSGYGVSCVPATVTLTGATASGSAGQAYPWQLRKVTPSGNRLFFDSCYIDYFGWQCSQVGPITFDCAP
jgi:hypothetical protein